MDLTVLHSTLNHYATVLQYMYDNLIINELNRRRENFRLAWELRNYREDREEGRNNRNNVTSRNWIVIIVKDES